MGQAVGCEVPPPGSCTPRIQVAAETRVPGTLLAVGCYLVSPPLSSPFAGIPTA
jgi:hypothetical protein